MIGNFIPILRILRIICLEHEVTASFDLVSSWVLRAQFQNIPWCLRNSAHGVAFWDKKLPSLLTGIAAFYVLTGALGYQLCGRWGRYGGRGFACGGIDLGKSRQSYKNKIGM